MNVIKKNIMLSKKIYNNNLDIYLNKFRIDQIFNTLKIIAIKKKNNPNLNEACYLSLYDFSKLYQHVTLRRQYLKISFERICFSIILNYFQKNNK